MPRSSFLLAVSCVDKSVFGVTQLGTMTLPGKQLTSVALKVCTAFVLQFFVVFTLVSYRTLPYPVPYTVVSTIFMTYLVLGTFISVLHCELQDKKLLPEGLTPSGGLDPVSSLTSKAYHTWNSNF